MKHMPRVPAFARMVRNIRRRHPRELEDEIDWTDHELLDASPPPDERDAGK